MIVDALQSVFAQTYTDYEVLVIDDGSTDHTERTLQTWMSKIRYQKKANEGPSSARNVGLGRICSDYVAFLDSDDQWEPTFLETLMNVFSEKPELGLVTSARLEIPQERPRPRIPRTRIDGDLYPLLFQRNFVTTSGVVAKRECFDTVGLFNEGLMQTGDYDMWLRIAGSYPIAFLKEHLCRYRCHPNNISKNELRHKLCLQKVLDANYDPTRIPDKVWRYRRSEVWTNLGRIHMRHSQKLLAHQCFREALRLRPIRARLWRYFLMSWF